MKAAHGEANQDHVLCKCLGKASPGCQPEPPILPGRAPQQIPLLGQSTVMELFLGTKLVSRPQDKIKP